MHINSNNLGYLHMTDVILFDLLPSCFKISCLNCSKDIVDRKMMFSEHVFRKNCESCHKLVTVRIERYEHRLLLWHSSVDIKKGAPTTRTPSAGISISPKICNLDDVYAKKGKKNPRHQDEGIFSGSALPNFGQSFFGLRLNLIGSCKHYKKSHRWLRFPCCHKVYPCNQCHDIASDHTAEVKQFLLVSKTVVGHENDLWLLFCGTAFPRRFLFKVWRMSNNEQAGIEPAKLLWLTLRLLHIGMVEKDAGTKQEWAKKTTRNTED